MLKTTNYQMNKPELTDSPPDITVLNGNFDIIDEKLFAVIKAWEEFKNNGGSIGGPIITNRVERVIPANIIEHGYGLGIGLKSANGLDKMELVLGNNGGKRALYSIQRFGLGTPDFAFSEIWAGDFSKSINGYTQLPNGYILQWGTFRTNFTTNTAGTTDTQTIYFPIQFPTKVLNVGCTVGKNANYGNATWTSVISASAVPYVTGFSSEARINVTTGNATCNYDIQWVAIGH